MRSNVASYELQAFLKSNATTANLKRRKLKAASLSLVLFLLSDDNRKENIQWEKCFPGFSLISIFNVSHYTTHYLALLQKGGELKTLRTKFCNLQFSTWNNKLGESLRMKDSPPLVSITFWLALLLAVIYCDLHIYAQRGNCRRFPWLMIIIWTISRYPQMHFQLRFIFSLRKIHFIVFRVVLSYI